MNALRNVRIKRNLMIKDVAESVNISPQALSLYEKNLRTPPVDIAHRLALYYNVQMENLFPINTIGEDISKSELIPARPSKNNFDDVLYRISVYTKTGTGSKVSEASVFDSFDYYFTLSKSNGFFGLKLLDNRYAPDYLENDILIFERVVNNGEKIDLDNFSILVTSDEVGNNHLYRFLQSEKEQYLLSLENNKIIDINKNETITIIGKLREMRRKSDLFSLLKD